MPVLFSPYVEIVLENGLVAKATVVLVKSTLPFGESANVKSATEAPTIANTATATYWRQYWRRRTLVINFMKCPLYLKCLSAVYG
jgi:hypothetical protein